MRGGAAVAGEERGDAAARGAHHGVQHAERPDPRGRRDHRGVGEQQRAHLLQIGGGDAVVAVEEQDKGAVRAAQTGIARGGNAAVRLPHHLERHADRRVVRQRVQHAAGRVVGRAVVHDDDLFGQHGLHAQRQHRLAQHRPLVIAGHDRVDRVARRAHCAARLRHGAHRTARVADRDHAGGDIARDHAARADDHVVPNGHPGQDADTAADPDVAADRDRAGGFPPAVAGFRVERVFRGVKAAVRRDHHIVAEGDGRGVENDKVVVGVKALADADIEAVVAVKMRLDPQSLARRAEQPTQQCDALIRRGGRQGVKGVALRLGGVARGAERGIGRVVERAGDHFFLFCHGKAPPVGFSFDGARARNRRPSGNRGSAAPRA